MLQAWTKVVVRWAKGELAKEEPDEELEDILSNIDQEIDPKEVMTGSVFITLSMDLLYKCNYAATVEGLIFNKMLVDSVYMAPEFIPYWLKGVIFYLITLPMNFFSLVDDFIGGVLVYERLSNHQDLFDIGIVAGKLLRMIF